jgi:hypothetical protein
VKPAEIREGGLLAGVMFVQTFVPALYVQRSLWYSPMLVIPPNMRRRPFVLSNVKEGPVRGDGATVGAALSQLYIGLSWSWIEAAAPVPTTSVESAVPPAKSASDVQVRFVADAGPETSKNSPAVESNAIASTTENRLIRQVPLRSEAPPPRIRFPNGVGDK